MIFYAHGMVDPEPFEDVQLPADLINGKPIEDIVTDMGMGYATTSYHENGLVAAEAVEDIKALKDVVDNFFDCHTEYLRPDFLFLGGPSEGGLVTALTIEKYPKLFHGALSICGPIGNFYQQMQYNGDFHVLFNYFFGNYLAAVGKNIGTPLGVSEDVMWDWKTGTLKNEIGAILLSQPSKMKQLIKCAGVTANTDDNYAMMTAILECLRFNIMLTNDIINRVNGVPFNNKYTWYRGSDNDWKLNRQVQRIRTSSYYTAKNNAKKWETSGKIEIPVVAIHTTGDNVIPFWHNPAYRLKTFVNGNSLLHSGIPVNNYGHCAIEESHVIAALVILITKTGFIDIFSVEPDVFASKESMYNFEAILKENNVDVKFKN